jgi:hypothetical protein
VSKFAGSVADRKLAELRDQTEFANSNEVSTPVKNKAKSDRSFFMTSNENTVVRIQINKT